MMNAFLVLFAVFALLLGAVWILVAWTPKEFGIKYRILKFCATERTLEEIVLRFPSVAPDRLENYLDVLAVKGNLVLRWDLERYPAVKTYSAL